MMIFVGKFNKQLKVYHFQIKFKGMKIIITKL